MGLLLVALVEGIDGGVGKWARGVWGVKEGEVDANGVVFDSLVFIRVYELDGDVERNGGVLRVGGVGEGFVEGRDVN